MIKRILLLAAASLSLLAGAAVAQGATKHKATFAVDAHVLRSANDVTTWAGTVDGKLGHGAVVFTTTANQPTFSAQALFPNGSINASGTNTAVQNPDGTFSFTGKLTIKGGTGAFKGAKGSATLAGATTKDDPARAVYTVTGTLTY
jgi:hypothetical protein